MARKRIGSDRSFVFNDKAYLGPEKRAEIEKKIAALRHQVAHIGHGATVDPGKPWVYNPSSTDVAQMRREIGKLMKILARRTPAEASTGTKNALYKRAKELERQIRAEMPTRDEMMGKRYLDGNGKPYVVPEEGAIRKQMDWQVKQAGNVKEWKQIMRILEPLDPNATNIERLRKGH